MGNTETTFISNLYSSWVNPKAFPSYDEPPKNDPLYGFTEERKPRGKCHSLYLIICVRSSFDSS